MKTERKIKEELKEINMNIKSIFEFLEEAPPLTSSENPKISLHIAKYSLGSKITSN
jgi:hypothetical protein